MILWRRNIKFVIHRYWSPSLGKVIEGEVPEGFKGSEFGPSLRSFVIYQYYKCRIPHKKILTMLKDWEIEMSAGTLCCLLNSAGKDFKDDLLSAKKAALKKKSQLYIDDTGARINGINGYTYGISNDYFTEYVTGLEKNRWSAVGALLSGEQRFLISDDGSNFIDLIRNHQLCWVHEIRKYKKLPIYHEFLVPKLEEVVKKWQGLYHLMKEFKVSGAQILRSKIREEFDRIVEAKTGIEDIDKQLKLTGENKRRLLLFLRYPQLPHHSNMIERDLRERVIKRKISLQNRAFGDIWRIGSRNEKRFPILVSSWHHYR